MKIYHTATQEDYEDLMIELEKQGFKWATGEKPTKEFNYKKYKSATTITTYRNKIQYACVKDELERDPDVRIIEYKAKGDEQMLTTECKRCHKKRHHDNANYCSMCGKKLVDETEFKSGDIVASQVLLDGSFSFVRLNEDLTNRLTSVDGFWYFKRDCTVVDVSLEVFKEYTRHATPEEIAEYESALNFHKHGRKPFEVKNDDLIRDDEGTIFFVDFQNNWKKEYFTSCRYTFLKTAEEVNEWLGVDNE